MAIQPRRPASRNPAVIRATIASARKSDTGKFRWNPQQAQAGIVDRLLKKGVPTAKAEAKAKLEEGRLRKVATKRMGKQIAQQQRSQKKLALLGKAYKARLAFKAYKTLIQKPLSNLAGWGRYR